MEPHLPADPLSRRPAIPDRDAFRPESPRDRVAVDGPCVRSRDRARAGLYLHVPFCASRCTYCDFSSGERSAVAVERWFAALEREVARRAPDAAELRFSSVFFGGGTPSAIPARRFTQVWNLLAAHFTIEPDAEITLEANPESVRPALLEAWASAGVNRLSMGAQSFDPDELRLLGRVHPAERPPEAVALAREFGFERLSLDLMYGFPGHTQTTWEQSVERALGCDIEHLSAYCFIPEPGTPLGDASLAGRAQLPEPEMQADLYAWLTERTARAGLGAYETSNFCRPLAEARHNLVYWLRRPYVGLGPSAHGLVHGERYGNHYALAHWADSLERGGSGEAEREGETAESRTEETIMLALRLGTGLRFADLDRAGRAEIERKYSGAFDAACALGRLETTRGGVRVPPRLRFMADDVIAWIEARVAGTRVDSARADRIIPSPCPSLPFPAI
jgi:oxygen-independent coproporphyrinogen-3 oxidase